MKRNGKVAWSIIGLVIALLIVMGSYFYSSAKQKDQLAREAESYQKIEVNNVEKDEVRNSEAGVKAFLENREDTNALDYLYYVASEGEEPVVAGVQSLDAAIGVEQSAVESLKKLGLDNLSYTSSDLTHLTTGEILKNDWLENVNEGQPQLVLLPTFSENDYENDANIETHLENLKVMYDEQRKENPNALVIFEILPPSSEELFEDTDYQEYIKEVMNLIEEEQWNVYNLFDDTIASTEAFAEVGFSESGNQAIQERLVEHLKNTSINAITGFNGNNEEAIAAAEAESQSEAESIAIEESEAAAAESERIAEEERLASESAASSAAEAAARAEAESQSQIEQQSQSEQNSNEQTNNNEGENPSNSGVENPNGNEAAVNNSTPVQ